MPRAIQLRIDSWSWVIWWWFDECIHLSICRYRCTVSVSISIPQSVSVAISVSVVRMQTTPQLQSPCSSCNNNNKWGICNWNEKPALALVAASTAHTQLRSCNLQFYVGATLRQEQSLWPSPPSCSCQCRATNENANKGNPLVRSVCVCSVSVRVTRQRGASNPCPATARQLNGSVSSPARNEQCMIYFRTQFACFLKPGNRNLPRPIPQPPFSCIDKASTGSARSRRKRT